MKNRLYIPGNKEYKGRYIFKKSKRYFVMMMGGSYLSDINNRAVDLALKGRLKEAEVLFKEVLSENPNIDAVYNNLGIIYEISGCREKAFDMYSKACIKDSDNSYFKRNFLFFADDRKE